MNAKEKRLLDPALLPASLWDEASKILLLPLINVINTTGDLALITDGERR